MTETTSEPGRVTWNGVCADAGCTEQVYAKRVPRDVRPPTDDAAQSPPSDDPHSVREVSYDKPIPKHKQQQPEQRPDERGGAVPPAVESAPAAGPVVEQQPERQPASDQLPDGSTGTGRLVGRRRQRAERPSARYEFRPPGW